MNRNSTKVFTEKGPYMLATILHSPHATAVTFSNIETFAKVRSLKRELLELHEETDKEKQVSKLKHTVKRVRKEDPKKEYLPEHKDRPACKQGLAFFCRSLWGIGANCSCPHLPSASS